MSALDDPASGTPADAPEALLFADDLVAAIGRFLRRVWAEPPARARARDLAWALATAADRVDACSVDAAGFDPVFAGQTPRRLLDVAAELVAGLEPAERCSVHGELRLADLRIDGGEVVGWRRVPAGAGDRYVDLASLARDLAAAIGPAAVPALFDAAGIDRPEPVRLEAWVLLGQLLGDGSAAPTSAPSAAPSSAQTSG